MIKPVSGTVTQEFSSSHTAIDIAAPCGTPVYASASGIVEAVRTGSTGRGDTGAYGMGNYVILHHYARPGYSSSEDKCTKYLHLDSVNVNQGCQVSQGQKIGTVGNTGTTDGITGCHLDFRVSLGTRSGNEVNPRNYISF
jgi:murein DD-endopeptidase MepM/ murein hydrolase activator NlpD